MRWPSHRTTRQIVDHGTVWCPRQQTDVDVDDCFTCSEFRDLVREKADSPAVVVCQAASEPQPFLPYLSR